MSIKMMLWEIVLQLAGLGGATALIVGVFSHNEELWRWGATILLIQIATDTNRRFWR